MLLLSPMLVTQSLTKTADLLTQLNKRLKHDAIVYDYARLTSC